MISIDEKQISLIMEKLKCTREEALSVISSDKAIDKGAKLFELTNEQKEVSRKMSAAGTRKPTVYNFQKRERKVDATKEQIIQSLVGAVGPLADSNSLEIQNKEREFIFTISGKKYKVTLSAPRS